MGVNRHYKRIMVMQALFEWEQRSGDRDPHELLDYVIKNFSRQDEIGTFEHELITGIIRELPTLQSRIMKHAPEWPLHRIAPVDRAILYIGMYEIIFTDVPVPVVINEAIEMAKEYGSENSSRFINGVLSALVKDRSST